MPRIRARYQDPEGRNFNGFPTYAWGLVPAGLATRRQLRDRRLRPNGNDPVAQLLWGPTKNPRVAYLYDITTAAPMREMSEGRRRTVEAMLRVRSTCKGCGAVAGYCLPRKYGRLCAQCIEAEGGYAYV